MYARPLIQHLARMINTFGLRDNSIQYYILKTMLHLIPLAKHDHIVSMKCEYLKSLILKNILIKEHIILDTE